MTYGPTRRRLLRGVVVALIGLAAAPATPAFADPAGPTDYRSVVDGIEPATDAVEVSVVGGDAFVRVDVRPGHEVLVLGYWDEPYARVGADGTVEVNSSSPSVLQNTSRYGVATEDRADRDGEPRWEPTGERGSFVWHDHRSHWMAPGKAAVSEGGLVQRWELPLVVDGEEVTVRGSLYRHASPGGWWWLVPFAGAAVVLAIPRWRAGTVAAMGSMGVVTGVIDGLSLPGAARPGWVPVMLGIAAALAGALAILGRSTWWCHAVLAGGGAALALMGWIQRGVLTHAFVPGPSPDGLVRIVVGLSLGAGSVVALASAFSATGIRLGIRRAADATAGSSADRLAT